MGDQTERGGGGGGLVGGGWGGWLARRPLSATLPVTDLCLVAGKCPLTGGGQEERPGHSAGQR